VTFHWAVLMNGLGNQVCALPCMTFDSSSGQAHESQDLLGYLDAGAHPICRG
jgi:hypothetical protein